MLEPGKHTHKQILNQHSPKHTVQKVWKICNASVWPSTQRYRHMEPPSIVVTNYCEQHYFQVAGHKSAEWENLPSVACYIICLTLKATWDSEGNFGCTYHQFCFCLCRQRASFTVTNIHILFLGDLAFWGMIFKFGFDFKNFCSIFLQEIGKERGRMEQPQTWFIKI